MYQRLLRVIGKDKMFRLTGFFLGCLLAIFVVKKLLMISDGFTTMADHGSTNGYRPPYTSLRGEMSLKNETVRQGDLWNSFVAAMAEHRPSSGSISVQTHSNIVPSMQEMLESSMWETTTRFENVMLSEEDLKASAITHKSFVDGLYKFEGLVAYNPGTTGIVYVGGDSYTEMLYTTIRLLRRTGCTLPIQIFLPSEEDRDPWLCDRQYEFYNDVECRVLQKPSGFDIQRYQFKALALLQSTFENVLLLDADNFPTADPTSWFTHPAYIRTGLIHWRDFWISTRSSQWHLIADTVPTQLRAEVTHETGQLLISRSIHAHTLLLATYYNIYGPSFFYTLLSQWAPGMGDKETFSNAAEALSLPSHTVEAFVHAEGFHTAGPDSTFQSVAMAQPNPFESSGYQVGLMHQQIAKLRPGEIVENLESRGLVDRMYGPRDVSVSRFGYDLEAVVWQELVAVTCSMRRYSLDVCLNVVQRWTTIQLMDEK